MLGFHPQFTIDCNWDNLMVLAQSVAETFIRNGEFQKNLMYEQGASQVSSLPGGGWISKSGPSQDFFVLGGIPELEEIGSRFQKKFPSLTFTPATIGCTSGNVPVHRDHRKNGLTSLIYPLHDNPSLGRVFDPLGKQDFYYLCQKYQMIAIDISQQHTVYVHEPRTWFTIHCHESIDQVFQTFNNQAPIVL